MEVFEEVVRRDARGFSILRVGDDGLNDLQEVGDHHAESRLEDDGLGSAADQMRQMENVADLLKHALDVPAFAVEFQKIVGGEAVGVHQVGDDLQRFVLRPLQSDATRGAAAFATAGQRADFVLPARPRSSTPVRTGCVESG